MVYVVAVRWVVQIVRHTPSLGKVDRRGSLIDSRLVQSPYKICIDDVGNYIWAARIDRCGTSWIERIWVRWTGEKLLFIEDI